MKISTFARHGRKPTTRAVLVCTGDSITHGYISADWVHSLESQLAGDDVEVLNAGVSGDLSYNVLNRLDDVIACAPDFVTVLVGTNDVAAHISDEWMNGYLRAQKPPQTPTIDTYRRWLTEIVKRLQTETFARIALLEIPPLTEVLDSPENNRVQAYNAIVHETAQASDISVLPLWAEFVAQLTPRTSAPPFDRTKKAMLGAFVGHVIFRRSWNSISKRRGFTLLTDHVHLNERAGHIVEEQVRAWLRSEQQI